VAIARSTLEKRRVDRDLEETGDWFRARQREKAAEDAIVRQQREAQIAEERRQRWKHQWIEQAFNSVTFGCAPRGGDRSPRCSRRGTVRASTGPSSVDHSTLGRSGRTTGSATVDAEIGNRKGAENSDKQAALGCAEEAGVRSDETARQSRSVRSTASAARRGQLSLDGDRRGAGGAASDPRA
jgi:hypothetical protein